MLRSDRHLHFCAVANAFHGAAFQIAAQDEGGKQGSLKVLIDDSGRRPIAPDPAYQQIIKGMPAVDYSSDELLYLKHNPRSNKVYGYSHVEQITLTVNTAIRRDVSVLEYYREGSQPDAFLGLPETSYCYHHCMFRLGRPGTPGQWLSHVVLAFVAVFLIWWLLHMYAH